MEKEKNGKDEKYEKKNPGPGGGPAYLQTARYLSIPTDMIR